MTPNPPSVMQWTASALRHWLGGAVPDPPAAGELEQTARFLRDQRLDILAAGWNLPGVGSPVEYARQALFQQRLLSEGVRLATRLHADGIPCLCLRGPFAAATLYPDPADRPFRDLDLLIPREHARQSLNVFRRAGFRLDQPRMPASYFLRNHLHWMTVRDRDGIVCDLHWAVEHRFRPYRIDLNSLFERARPIESRGFTWHEPALEHQFLLSALHARKHLPAVFDPLDTSSTLFAPGCLFQWLDLALLSRRPINWILTSRLAADWNVEPVIGLAVRQLREALGVHLPEPMAALEAKAPSSVARLPAWTGRLALPGLGRKACFRSSKVADAVEYIARPHPSGRLLPTALRRVGAFLQVGVAAADTLVCAGWAGLGRKRHPAHNRPDSP